MKPPVCPNCKEELGIVSSTVRVSGNTENVLAPRAEIDGDYSPENCRWVTALEQTRNQSKNVTNYETMTRICNKCKIEKPLTEFHVNKKESLGKDYLCKLCTRKEYLKRNPHRKRSVSRIEHLFIIECSEYMSLRAIGRRISRSTATIRIHLIRHEESLYVTGSCPWCDADPVYKR